jgi:hypothetical protein
MKEIRPDVLTDMQKASSKFQRGFLSLSFRNPYKTPPKYVRLLKNS